MQTVHCSGLGSFVDVGKNLVKGLWEGIQSLASWIWDKVSSWAGNLWDGICSFFGIHSPSRKMAWVGDMLMMGLAGGIDETAGEAIDSAIEFTDVLAVQPKKKLCHLGWASHMAYHANPKNVIRIDYEKYINGEKKYFV